ncbi:hypothetical protein KAFR_0C05050 [Kazachstania africana CBS 2517]|uniref:Sorting nexin-3 n=1 Tax=Kazachstania africana (strain ATCC 22294 / BCRC 22015 / CBS 2517 / CECT 1963 / NBRC 1671 / NRRL Y-8276) TaxID=1071382 RepID=H2ASZ6_KAZAF|nr:hypothetical protein KAFR_0C05050 [Kazachstania africana CBS 2517]CCF57496.1 hypothetical protein KAFR_0C05050 [Kazachstania africana CBS 2517]
MKEFRSFGSAEQSLLSKSHKQQSYNEIYAEPENFLEIEVTNPITHHTNNGEYTNETFTDYEIICKTNLPNFKLKYSKVRRRYSDFEFFKKCLLKEMNLLGNSSYNSSRINIPHLPGKIFLSNRFNNEVIEERRQGLNKWLNSVATHPLLQSSSHILVRFIQNEKFIG